MSKTVADIRANRNEGIEHAVAAIGSSKARRKIFEAVYKGKKHHKTVTEIAKQTGMTEAHVLTEGKKLVADDIMNQIKVGSPKKTAYKKDDFYSNHKTKVLKRLDNPKSASKYPTKQRPLVASTVVQKITVAKSNVPRQLFVDDFASFAAVRKVSLPQNRDFARLPEQQIKEGFQRVLQQEGSFRDWGGETSDLYTGKLRIKGTRIAAAFAFKGKATKGALTPGKMGKNGDQIGRLFTAPAQVFFIIYPRAIQDSVISSMHAHAVAKATTGQKIFFCAIGGSDFARLFDAYLTKFQRPKGSKKP